MVCFDHNSSGITRISTSHKCRMRSWLSVKQLLDRHENKKITFSRFKLRANCPLMLKFDSCSTFLPFILNIFNFTRCTFSSFFFRHLILFWNLLVFALIGSRSRQIRVWRFFSGPDGHSRYERRRSWKKSYLRRRRCNRRRWTVGRIEKVREDEEAAGLGADFFELFWHRLLADRKD